MQAIPQVEQDLDCACGPQVGSKELPAADVTVREVVRLLAKALLLFLPALQQHLAFGALWRAILDAMQVGVNRCLAYSFSASKS